MIREPKVVRAALGDTHRYPYRLESQGFSTQVIIFLRSAVMRRPKIKMIT
jgi:hypothetical protein